MLSKQTHKPEFILMQTSRHNENYHLQQKIRPAFVFHSKCSKCLLFLQTKKRAGAVASA